ncbi:MAG: hypothetical protein WCA38_06780 [Candidatus Acidiferrales bacterium]
MRINQLAPLAQSTQRALTEYEVFLPGVGKCKPSLAPPHKQQIKILFKPGKGPAYRRDWKLEIGGRGAECPRLSNSNEYVHTIEVGSFAHAQDGCGF